MNKLKSLERLENSLSKLPSIGKKSGERIAYAMLSMSDEDLEEFSSAVKELKANIHTCPICGMITDQDECVFCNDTSRDETTIMVVSYAKDVISIEKSEGYHGLYHVLNGEISMSKNKNAEDLNLESLFTRLESGKVKEVILATNPTVDGEITSLYIAKLLEKYNVNTTKLAFGLQMGGALDYTDKLTLLKSLEGRRKI